MVLLLLPLVVVLLPWMVPLRVAQQPRPSVPHPVLPGPLPWVVGASLVAVHCILIGLPRLSHPPHSSVPLALPLLLVALVPLMLVALALVVLVRLLLVALVPLVLLALVVVLVRLLLVAFKRRLQ